MTNLPLPAPPPSISHNTKQRSVEEIFGGFYENQGKINILLFITLQFNSSDSYVKIVLFIKKKYYLPYAVSPTNLLVFGLIKNYATRIAI